MNNKGQSLVVFVILLPVFLILIAFSIDIGYMIIEKNKLNDINKTSIKYLVKDKQDEQVVKDIIRRNDKKIHIEKMTHNEIILSKKVNSIFGGIVNLKTYKISSNLSGKMIDNKLIIEKGK